MAEENKLPPLPSSDYKGFWGDNEILKIEDLPMKKCDHKFKLVPEGAECKICHFGLIGSFEISNEKLSYQGKLLGI